MAKAKAKPLFVKKPTPGSAPILAKVRALCLSFPEATERPSHGAPAFFLRGKTCFLMWADNHHGDGRLAVWCAAAPGAQAMLVDSEPEHYFIPPYVGVGGWVGVRLDRAAWSEISSVIENAYLARAALRTRSTGRSTTRRPS